MGIFRFLLLLLACTGFYAERLSERPHIVFILADDLGWNDVSFHGSKQIPTPNIDALARDGIILNQYYVQPICSPSRAALMTGKYPIRLGFQHDVIKASEPWGLPLKETILPQYLKALEYSTHAVGKWHLGFFKEDYLPLRRGFDSFFGYYNGLEDYFTHFSELGNLTGLDLHNGYADAWWYNGTYGTDLYTCKAKEIILEHDPAKPLFLYLAQQAPHSGNFQSQPLQAPRKYTEPLVGIEDEKRHIHAGMVSSLDHSVGEIFAALEESGLLDNTLFVFSTDNGGAPQGVDGTSGSNWPLRGSKYTLWEGGVRGVSFIWSPILRQNSRIYNKLMHITDWLPTLLSASGGVEALKMLPQGMDGVDHWPSLLLGAAECPRQEILLNWDQEEPGAAGIRKGQFKLVTGSYHMGPFDNWYNSDGRLLVQPHPRKTYEKNYSRFLRRSQAARVLREKYGRDPELAASCQTLDCRKELELELRCGHSPAYPCDAREEPCLYDLDADPCEHVSVARRLPTVVAELSQSIQKYIPHAIPFGAKPPDPEADPKLHGNVWRPWK